MESCPGSPLSRAAPGRQRVSVASTVRQTNPYPGLTPFDERDAALFFGRDREIEEVLQRLTSRRLLAVIGVSGCGKSSLIRAGVIPILRMGVAPNLPARWRICTMNPGTHPLRSLQAALNAPSGWPANSFDLADYARKNLSPGETLLLIVDQFEELFRFRDETICEDGGNAASLFVNNLLTAVEQRDVPICILLTMRTDFLGNCAQFRGLPEALNDCYYLVPRLTRLQQQEAIERPLQEHGGAMHPALVQRLLNDSAEDPDHLPVLQHLLRRLWENWGKRRKPANEPIGLTDYYAVGGWTNALNADAEAVMTRFTRSEDGIRRMFQWITEHGGGEQPVRRPRTFSECLQVSGLEKQRLREITSAFQERGLLRISDQTEQSVVDLPHESVMWQWSRLKNWIAEEAEQAAQLRFFLQSAHRQNPLTGLALHSASKWRLDLRSQIYSAPRYLTPEQLKETEAWIIRSEQIDKAQRRRRLWTVGSVAACLAVLAIIALVVARRDENSAEAGELAAWSAVSLSQDPERSLILGLYSWRKQRSMVPGLEEFLHTAVLQSSSRLVLLGHRDTVSSVAWSPDGTKLATASQDKTAKVWDAHGRGELLTLPGHDGSVTSIAWSPDGKTIATASDDGTSKLWEAATGHELLTLKGTLGRMWKIVWSPDGSKLATISDRGRELWDASTGRKVLTLPGTADYATLAWSPDGSKLASSGAEATVSIWEPETGRELLVLRGHQGGVTGMAWSPDGHKLATSSWDKTARVWDATNGQALLTVRGHQGGVRGIAWSPDGSTLATASSDNTARTWSVESGNELQTLQGHHNSINTIAWSPDGTMLATGSDDFTTKIWDPRNGHEMLTLNGHKNSINTIAWSPDGTMVATGSDDLTAKIWDPRNGHEMLTLNGHSGGVLSLAWAPDSTRVATAGFDMTARVWDAATGRPLLILRHRSVIESIAWSPDGTRLATASWDKTAKIWDAASGKELLTLGE